MADITNAEAIRWVNEVVRPMAERMRSLKSDIDVAIVTWWGGVNMLIPNDTSPLADGREAEGVSRLTGIDVNSLVAQMAAYQSALNASGVPQVISKPCVRSLESSR